MQKNQMLLFCTFHIVIPVYHGSAKDNLGTEKLIEAITETFITETDDIQSELCGYVL